MPYQRPSLPQIVQLVQNDISSRLAGTNPFLPYSDLQILSYVFAGNQYALYSYLDWIAKQAIPVTSSDEALLAWGALKGLTLKPATGASGTVTFTGTPGSNVPDETIVIRPDGIQYAIPVGSGGVLGANGTFSTMVIAITTGVASNMQIGDIIAANMSLTVPLSGVQSTVAVTSNFTGGADDETQDSFRSRVVESFSNPVQGGDLADYVTWSLQLPGITRAWSAGPAVMGAGSVIVYFCMDDTSHVNGIPNGTTGVSQFEGRGPAATGDCLILADYLYPLRSATAIVWCAAPAPFSVNLTLAEVPNDATIHANIALALSAFMIRKASPGGVVLPDETLGGIIRVSQLETALSAVPGLDFYELIQLNGVSPADVTAPVGSLPVIGNINYV